MPRSGAPRPPGLFTQARRIARKDLQIEWKSREIVYTMGFLAAVIVLIFAFSFIAGADEELAPDVVSGILWTAVLFSGTVGLSRTFDREREGEAIRSLLLAPVPRTAIYLGKLAATVFLMFLVQLVVAPLCALFFHADLGAHAPHLALLLVLGSWGFAAVGVVFSGALLRSRSRDVLLSSLLFPIVLPVLLAGAKGTSNLLDPTAANRDAALFWTQFLLAVDVLFTIVGLWAFEPVVTGE